MKSPYFNATLTSEDLKLAKKRLSRFFIVGINEAYDASVQLLLRMMGIQLRDDQIHLPASMTSTYSADHEQLKARARWGGSCQCCHSLFAIRIFLMALLYI